MTLELSTTVHGALDAAAANSPDVLARFPSVSDSIGYARLAESARTTAGALVAAGLIRGEPVGILCPNAPEFLTSFFAVLAAGGAACPLPLPFGLRDMGTYPQRLARVVDAASMRTILVSHRLGQMVEPLRTAVPGVRLTSTDSAAAGCGALPEVTGDDVAVVQFTSGSTAVPKGVRLTHRNVLAGLMAIRDGIALGPADGGGFWLPLFHDMGLFGTLSAVLNGLPAHVWSPTSFVKDPARWLREFLASGATISAMPNFGYDLLTAAVSPVDVGELDMTRWRIAFNGAEPIGVESVAAFLDRFASAGFRPEAMFVVYGMAEATLAVTFPPLGRGPVFDWVHRQRLADDGCAVPVEPGTAGARAVAGVGRPVSGLELRIVAADTGASVADGTVGEIQVRGASVTPGYLGADAHESFADGWLRTGDLGYQRNGELFITGRLKEMITVRGANFYPQDVEAIARTVHGVYRGRCVALAGANGTEEMLLIAETALTGTAAEALTDELRRRVSAEIGLAEVTVHLVAPRAIPRTSSGKVRRLASRELLSRVGP